MAAGRYITGLPQWVSAAERSHLPTVSGQCDKTALPPG